MSLKKTFGPLLLIPLLLSGCVTNTITNLTPSRLPRNDTGYYPIEMVWDSNQQSMMDFTVKPYVMVGFNAYEMRKTLGLDDRFEAMVPVAADQEFLTYSFKVDYKYRRVGKQPGEGSKLSRVFTLRILDE